MLYLGLGAIVFVPIFKIDNTFATLCGYDVVTWVLWLFLLKCIVILNSVFTEFNAEESDAQGIP